MDGGVATTFLLGIIPSLILFYYVSSVHKLSIFKAYLVWNFKPAPGVIKRGLYLT